MFRDRVKKNIGVTLVGFLLTGACGDELQAGKDEGDDFTNDSEGDDGGTADSGMAEFEVQISLASDVDPKAPGTIGIVTWAIDRNDVTEAKIDFGLDTSYGMTAPVDLADVEHRTLLLGMKPNRTYHLRVVALAGGREYASDDYTVATGSATNLVGVSERVVFDESGHEPGFIVTTDWNLQGDGSGSTAFIIDPDGEIAWWYQASIGAISAARMSADGASMWMVTAGFEDSAIERVTMDTLESQVYPGRGAPSHDIVPVTGDVMAYLDYEGTPNQSIVEIDSTGQTTIISSLEGITVEHANSLRYSPEEDLYVYSDWQNDVFAINRRDGSIAWSLSGVVPFDWGPTQHGTHLLSDSILIFANNGAGFDAAAFEYARSDGSILLSYSTGLMVTHLGDVQRLPGGNTLVTCATTGRIHEIDSSANLVMSLRTSPLGYAHWRRSLYGPPEAP